MTPRFAQKEKRSGRKPRLKGIDKTNRAVGKRIMAKAKHNPTDDERKRKNKHRRMARLEIRVHTSEKLAIESKAKACGSDVSTLVRETFNRVQTWTAKDKSEYRKRTMQIARIGSNINQIAGWANTYKSNAEAIDVIAHLQAISQEINELAKDD